MTTAPLTDRPIDGRYTVLRHLAEGGMGSVYIARDERLGREVALKVMRPDLASDPVFVERFRAEAQSAARLTDQHVVGVYDQGRDGDLMFLTMELVHGHTLRQRLDEVGAFTPREAFDVMDSVLAALAAAHAIGIVHRDVKPENVLIRDDGVVKVADFGLARAVSTRTSTALGQGVLGTFAYVSPELVSTGVADARSDVYAAALILFEMLTGRMAFSGDSPIHVAFRHVHEKVSPPSSVDDGLVPAIDDIVLAGAATDPDERPADAGRYRTLLGVSRRELGAAQLDRVPPAAVDHTPPSTDRSAPTETLRTSLLANRTRVLPVVRATSTGPNASEPGTSTGGMLDVEQNRTRRRRGRWVGVVATLVAVLLTLGAAWVFLAGPGALRQVPDVTGQERFTAVAQLEEAGFRTDVVEAHSEDVPAGDVISTDPAGDSEARALAAVEVTVSKGPERYAVPDVTDQSLGRATEAITGANLSVGPRTDDWSETVAVGNVIRTDPPAGTALPPGSQVAIVTSKGREPIRIDDWTGENIDEARSELEGRGLQVVVGEERFDDEVPAGDIVSQQPGPTTLHRGDTVTFVVSKGPDVVPVPDVQGEQEAEATRILQDAGFEVEVERVIGGIFGTVRETEPAAGENAPRGGTIVMRVV